MNSDLKQIHNSSYILYTCLLKFIRIRAKLSLGESSKSNNADERSSLPLTQNQSKDMCQSEPGSFSGSNESQDKVKYDEYT